MPRDDRVSKPMRMNDGLGKKIQNDLAHAYAQDECYKNTRSIPKANQGCHSI